jgi:hypothetical protein
MTHHPYALITSTKPVAPAPPNPQRPYDPPAVVYEAALEVRAGSPLGLPAPANPLDLP